MAFPPLGIETLAPVVRQHGHRVRMFDTCHPQMKAEHIVKAVKEEPGCDCALISFYHDLPANQNYGWATKTSRSAYPIILGGVFASMNAELILKDCPHADCIGVGEGEELLPDYLDNIDHPGEVAGLVWRNGDEVIRNEPRPLIRDLDQFPYPDRDSLPIDYIESMPLDVPAVLSLDKFCTIQTSRGCPYGCIYCDIPSLSNGKWRHRSAEHVLGEMQQLNDAGYRSIYLTDDHFLLKRSASRISATVLSNAGLSLPGAARVGSIRWPLTSCRLWQGQLQLFGVWRRSRNTKSVSTGSIKTRPWSKSNMR